MTRRSREVGTSRIEIESIERLAGGHEEAVSLGTTKADIGADLGKENQADPNAVRGEYMDAVVTFADPAGSRVNVPLSIGADAIGEAGLLAVRYP